LAWTLKARIDSHCLAQRKVECRVCGEACQARAISFRPVPGGVALPEFDPARCTGCGDCVRPCPVSAVSMQPAQAGHAHQR
jgi:ferredoxin-type protein NapF